MSKPPKDKTLDDGLPHEEIVNADDELTRPLRRRKPTAPPPPAPAAIRPQAPPTAPMSTPTPIQRGADVEPTRRSRRPTVAPPPAPAGIRPQAPPTSPLSPPRPPLLDDEDESHDGEGGGVPASDPFSGLSQPARALMQDVAGCVPMDSSFDLSQKITDHLATYWEARRDRLITDDDGVLEKDYVSSLRIARSIIAGSLSGGVENLVEEAKSISDELDATSIGYYARNLPVNELRVVQSFHDLAVALMFYKVSFHVDDPADRQVMLASSMGAQGSLQGALDWFAGLGVPDVISTYASRLEFKIDAETRRGSH